MAPAGYDTGERFAFVMRAHLSLSRGGSVYLYRCEDFGITCEEGRPNRSAPWTREFRADDIEDEAFPTLAACVAALWALHAPELAATLRPLSS